MPDQERRASWHLVHPDGRYTSRGGGGIDLLAALGYSRASVAAARWSGSVERAYTFVSTHRDTLGRFVPYGPAPRRFP